MNLFIRFLRFSLFGLIVGFGLATTASAQYIHFVCGSENDGDIDVSVPLQPQGNGFYGISGANIAKFPTSGIVLNTYVSSSRAPFGQAAAVDQLSLNFISRTGNGAVTVGSVIAPLNRTAPGGSGSGSTEVSSRVLFQGSPAADPEGIQCHIGFWDIP